MSTDVSTEARDALRQILLLAMSEVSESDYAAGWLIGLDKILYRRGGNWRAAAEVTGWPLGVEGDGGWVSWDEAGRHYADPAP